MPRAPDIFRTIVSHLDSVARRENEFLDGDIKAETPTINWMKKWNGRRSFIAAVDVRPCQWVAVRSQIRLSFGISNVRACCREGCSKRNPGCYALPWRVPIFVRFSSCYRPAFSCYWASNLKLECRGGYELLTSVANVWSIDPPECRMPWDISTVNMYRAVVEEV